MTAAFAEKHLRHGAKLAQMGKYEDAIKEYRTALEFVPGDLQLMNTIGDLCVRAGRNQEAIKYFAFIARKYAAQNAVQQAIATLKKVNRLSPNNSETLTLMGDLYKQLGLAGDARQHYKLASDALRRVGNTGEAIRVLYRIGDVAGDEVENRAEMGESLLRSGFTDEAYNAFMQAGQECLRDERLDEAARIFDRVLRFRPDSRPALRGVTESLAQLGRGGEALALLDRALDLSPRDVDLLVILGRTYMRMGRLDEAERAFGRLLDVDETRYVYLLEVAQALIEASDFDRAVAIVERCADLMIARRHKKRATALLKDIVQRDNENLAALKLLATIYERVGEKRNLSTTLNALSQIAIKQGRRDVAIDALSRLAELEPGKRAHREQLDSIKGAPEDPDRGFSVVETGETPARDEEEMPGDSAEYSTELLQDVMSKHPEFRAAQIKLLEDLIASQPAYVEGRIKLKKHYLEAGMPEKAIGQCEAIVLLYEERGDEGRARGFADEARWLRAQFLGEPLAPRAAAADTSGSAGPARPIDADDQIEVRFPLSSFLSREYGRAAREMSSLSLSRIRTDGPAAIEASERVLAALEAEVRRPADVVLRVGDRDFLAVLPDTHAKGAALLAERLRARIESLGAVTASIGVASVVPQIEGTAQELLASADLALEEAKNAGGNRVVSAKL